MQELSSKNSRFKDSVIREMSVVAVKHGAVNLAQGFPDFDPPKEMLDRLAQVAYEGPHQYPMDMGAPNFRRAACAKVGRCVGYEIDPETEIDVTMGSTEAMLDTLLALTDPGDRIVMFSPFFENYKAQTITAQCEPVFVPLNPPTYTFDPARLEDEFKKGAKAFILCNPSNPSGRVYTMEEMTAIADLCKKYDVYCITDEVYEHIIFGGRKMVYMSTLPGMKERTIICGSLSKTYSITGWRLGYAIGPKNIIDKIKQYHSYVSVGAASPLMEAAVVGLEFPESYYEEFNAHYTKLKDLFISGLNTIGLPFSEPEGTYFMLADMSPYMRKSETDIEFCVRMAEELGVAVVPGSSFFNEPVHGIVRLHFAKKEETLSTALERLQGLKNLK